MKTLDDINIAFSSITNLDHGLNLKVVQPVNIYDCEIGNDCLVGPFVEIKKELKLEIHVKYNLIVLSVN